MEGSSDEMVVKVAPKIYLNYGIMSSKGKPLLYARIKKSLYGLIHNAPLLYRKLVKYLKAYGLQIKPYDQCMPNKMIKNKRMTVVCHVDDLNVSHVNRFEITNFVGYMSSIYGGIIV